ncbi:molybdopterin molybdotransferase MoeA [bacterium]|nr:molybdopterin molybdotransferase MoeA [bacterium]
MLSVPEAQRIIRANVQTLSVEVIALAEAHNRYLAQDVCSPFPLPRFDHSAVDGFAVLASDTAHADMENPCKLKVIGTVKTGSFPDAPVQPGCALRIFTGAMLPPCADAVVMIEDVSIEEETIHLRQPLKSNSNVRRAGEEFRYGDICLSKATRLSPAAIGLAATLGAAEVSVFRKPRVALIITGSELVELGESLDSAQIYDSNRYALMTALSELGIHHIVVYRCPDDEAAIRNRIEEVLSSCDVIITSGGASVGDLDYVKPAILSLGGTILFDKVSIKPGKPTVFATLNGKPVFGLPGNPVSALVTYLLFVKPALKFMSGAASEHIAPHAAILNTSISKRTSRTEFVRAKTFRDGNTEFVAPCTGQESHMLGGLVSANAFIIFDGEPRTIEARALVDVLPISWS